MQRGVRPRELAAHEAAAHVQRVVEEHQVRIGALGEAALVFEAEQLGWVQRARQQSCILGVLAVLLSLSLQPPPPSLTS